MSYCPNCGTSSNESAVVCLNCGSDLGPPLDGAAAVPPTTSTTRTSPSPIATAPPSTAPPVLQQGFRTLPDTQVVMGMDEKLWRRYEVTQLRRRSQGLGMLYVTDHRIVFHAQTASPAGGRRSLLVMETRLSTVQGSRSYISYRRHWFSLIIGLIFVIAAIGLLVTGGLGGAFISFVIGVILVIRGLMTQGTVTIQIFAQQISVSPINFGNAWSDRRGFFESFIRFISGPFGWLSAVFGLQDAFDFLFGLPGPDAVQVANEIGALIEDLQTKGNLAEEHWHVA